MVMTLGWFMALFYPHYPPVIQHSYWNWPIDSWFNSFTLQNLWFFIVMLVCQSSIGSLSETSKNRPRPGRHILQRQVELHRLRPAAWRVYLAASQETAGAEHGPGSDPETAGGPPKMLGEASNPGISDDGSFTWMIDETLRYRILGDLKAFVGIWCWILDDFGIS